MGDEVMGSLNNMLLAPCMNILRHPYWGRSQETYGEDMYHLGRMASALAAGIQEHVIATAKHFAANNIENGRANQVAVMDEQTLREVYVQHFAMVVQQGGVGSVMAAYNSIEENGVTLKCTQNNHLLGDILKGDPSTNGLGFRGFVISDWWAMPGGSDHASDTSLAQSQTIRAVNAGLDDEVPWSLHFAQLPSVVGQARRHHHGSDQRLRRPHLGAEVPIRDSVPDQRQRPQVGSLGAWHSDHCARRP